MSEENKTIFALATAPARAALGVIRISGPHAARALHDLARKSPPPPREARVRALSHPDTNAPLDEAMVLWMPGPHSFTGEDCVELHIHGGIAVADSILDALATRDGLRPAEAGEFTRRAVLNGRLDLTEAEGIADLIDAESLAQQEQALRQMRGELGAVYEAWRDRLKTALAHLEADIEFADEDLPGGLGAQAVANLSGIDAEIVSHLSDRRGERLREGISVAIIGAPNAGKSSIINKIAGRDAAIVSARAGTTRDVVEVALMLVGVPVSLADTAGIRDAGDDIEREGVARALKRADAADIRILVVAPDAPPAEAADLLQPGDFCVINKIDLGPSNVSAPPGVSLVSVSAQTGEGIAGLIDALTQAVGARFGIGERPALTRARHRAALEEARAHLQRALASADVPLELVAEDLRLASRALGRITGRVDVEALLDIVFSDFCIGK